MKLPSVQVGYTQKYGLYVHENLTARHPVGQAKFLETPARTMKKELTNQVLKMVQRLISPSYKISREVALRKALIVAGLRLQRASQLLVPVDTSALKASAYTAVEENAESAAQKSFSKSEEIRKGALKSK